MSNLKISIITPVFNGENTILHTIDSVASQTYRDVEHLVMDGGSRDRTIELVRANEEKISCFRSERDRGPYDAMNKGIRLASGDVIGILNADDFYARPDALELVAGAFQDPSVEACYADLVYVDREEPSKIIRYWKSCDYRSGLFENGWMPPHPTFFVRRGAYERFGAFNLEFKLAADFELLIRFLAKERIRTKYIPEVLVQMRVGGLSNRSLRNRVLQNVEGHKAGLLNGLSMPALPFFVLQKLRHRFPQYLNRPERKAA